MSTSGGVFMGAETNFHLHAKGKSFIFKAKFYTRDVILWSFVCLFLWKQTNWICFFFSDWKVACADNMLSVLSVFLLRGVYVCVYVCSCMFTTLWLTLLWQTAAQWTPVNVCVCIAVGVWSTAQQVACFSPWVAAGTSWSSGQVWWAGRWAAACGPAAAATPDSERWTQQHHSQHDSHDRKQCS